MMHVYLVRHGATDWTDENKLQGSTDNPLSKKGKLESESTAHALKAVDFDGVFCSPMVRSVETTEIICKKPGITPFIMNALREIDFGIYEGKQFSKKPVNAMRLWEKLWLLTRFQIAQLTGESTRSVHSRAVQSWDEIKKICPCGNILIVTHGLILGYLIRCMLPKNKYDEINSTHFEPCSINEIVFPEGQDAELIRINDINHLE